jgi:hypothetical protein
VRRGVRGPRRLAYYAIVDALAEAKKDRPKMVLDLANFLPNGSILQGHFDEPGADLSFNGHLPPLGRGAAQGVVGAVVKVPEGEQVTFKKVIVRLPDVECVDDVHHPLRIADDGRIEYYRNCRSLGTFTNYDQTPSPIVISPLLDAGVKPGAFIQYAPATGSASNGNSLAVVALTKRSPDEKKILSFFGFSL